MKLNTDGAYDADLQAAAGGGVVRDHTGAIILAFSTPLNAISSYDAEIQALLQGLRLITQLSVPVWVEMDAASVVSLLNSNRFGPAQTQHSVAAIRLLLCSLQVRVTHIHREGNRPADFLASCSLQLPNLTIYSPPSVPRRVAVMVRMDQFGLPNFRFRYVDN